MIKIDSTQSTYAVASNIINNNSNYVSAAIQYIKDILNISYTNNYVYIDIEMDRILYGDDSYH